MSANKNSKLFMLILFLLPLGLMYTSTTQPAYGQTLKTLKSQWPRGVRRVTLSAKIDISDYFNYRYSKSANTHYSFRITQGYEDINGYCRRSIDFCSALRSKIIKSGPSTQSVTISSDLGHDDSDIWTLLGWSEFASDLKSSGRKTKNSCVNYIIVGTKKECI